MKLKECTRCGLHTTRKQVVCGRGSLKAPVCFVGEAPGQTENAKGVPFVGRAGKLLDKFVEGLPLSPDGYYITNTVKCWPCTPEGKNRTPTEEEITTCAVWLDAELERQKPNVVVTLGRIALGRLTGTYEYAGRRGKLQKSNAYPFFIFPMYHPAFVLRGAVNAIEAWEADRIRLSMILRMSVTELEEAVNK